MKVVIDVQGFKTKNNKFIPKELAAYNGSQISHFIFKQPFKLDLLPWDVQRQVLWLTKNHHCIDWTEGFTSLHNFSNIIKKLTSNVDCVFVKGKEKADFIRKHSVRPVFELEEDPCIKPAKANCFYHLNPLCICALTNVHKFYNYLSSYNSLPM